jgi:hypothetical protein
MECISHGTALSAEYLFFKCIYLPFLHLKHSPHQIFSFGLPVFTDFRTLKITTIFIAIKTRILTKES